MSEWIKMEDHLKKMAERMPEWLADFRPGDPLDIREVLNSSRVLYYPGAWFDGQPVMTCNRAHYAHVFIYADYGVSRDECLQEAEEWGFRGYHILESRAIDERQIAPHGWHQHVQLTKEQMRSMRSWAVKPPFCQILIMERDEGYGDDHGAGRFAFIYFGGDGIATYDALFGNRNARLDMLVLQDHGWGGNYDSFGKGGLMDEIARKSGAYPELIMNGDNTFIWVGYHWAENVGPVCGGMHHTPRWLYERNQSNI